MITRQLSAIILISLLLALVSCSRSSSDPVTSPSLTGDQKDSGIDSISNEKAIWGFWDVSINTEDGAIEAVPVRGAEFKANVTIFLQPPKGKLSSMKFSNLDLSKWPSEGRIDLDVGLTHPFPGLDFYTGFDVMGVFMHNASSWATYDTALWPTNIPPDAYLENSDGNTRWFNWDEFPAGGIFGANPGKAGTPGFEPNGHINQFKYYADGLEADQDISDFFSVEDNCAKRGCFKSGSTNYRHYSLRFPLEGSEYILKFQYGVFASWKPYLEGPPYDPELFPPDANMAEPLILRADMSDSNVWFVDWDHFGGTLSIDLEVLDHQCPYNPSGVTGEIDRVVVESVMPLVPWASQVFDQATLESLAVPGGPQSSVYQIDIPDCTPYPEAHTYGVQIMISVYSADPTTYDNGLGLPYPEDIELAGYWAGYVSVSDTAPGGPPVGGDLSLHWDCSGDPCSGQEFTMEISEAYDPDGNPVTITWDFDGNMDFLDDKDGDNTNLSAKYTYDLPGTYEAWCRIDDGTDQTDIGPFEINVMDCLPDTPTVVKNVPDSTTLQARKIAYNAEDGYVYTCPHFSSGGYVSIVDVDPIEDAYVVKVVDLGSTIWLATIAYSNGYVYTSGGAGAGVFVIDVDPPEDAYLVGSWNPGGYVTGSMEDMHVVGNYLYVAAQWWGMIVLDITDPANPVHLGHTGTVHAFTSSVSVTPDNQWGYSTDGYHNDGYLSWINVIDLSIPSSPTVVKSLQIQNYDVLPTNSDVQGDYLYVVYHPWTGTGLLTIINVADPYNPYKVTDFNIGTGTWDVEVVGNYAYVSLGALSVVDISDPSSPSLFSSVPISPECRGTVVSCGTVYAASNLVDIVDLY